MSVSACQKCDRSISISRAKFGNPIALNDPDTWSVDYGTCRNCRPRGLLRVRPHYCDRCIAESTLCPVCQSELEIFRLPRQAGLPGEIVSAVADGTGSLAVLGKPGLHEVLAAVRDCAPCEVRWLNPGALQDTAAVIVAIDCSDVALESTFAPMSDLVSNGIPVIAVVLTNLIDGELGEWVELEVREVLNGYGYAGDELPVLRDEQTQELRQTIEESRVLFEAP